MQDKTKMGVKYEILDGTENNQLSFHDELVQILSKEQEKKRIVEEKERQIEEEYNNGYVRRTGMKIVRHIQKNLAKKSMFRRVAAQGNNCITFNLFLDSHNSRFKVPQQELEDFVRKQFSYETEKSGLFLSPLKAERHSYAEFDYVFPTIMATTIIAPLGFVLILNGIMQHNRVEVKYDLRWGIPDVWKEDLNVNSKVVSKVN